LSLFGEDQEKSLQIPLLDQSTFGPEYDEAVRQALSASDPETRLRLAAPIARQIHDIQSATFDLLRGAGVVAPELAKLEQRRECLRYERQERMIVSLRDAGRLQADLDDTTARDIFWMLTGRDIYRMLVRERRWSSEKYQDWLADTLVRLVIASPGEELDFGCCVSFAKRSTIFYEFDSQQGKDQLRDLHSCSGIYPGHTGPRGRIGISSSTF